MLRTLTVIVFSRSGYETLLGTPKGLLLRLSGNIMIISGRCKRGYCGDTYETLVKLTRDVKSYACSKYLGIIDSIGLLRMFRVGDLGVIFGISSNKMLRLEEV